jgi:hypothetical protein
LSAIHEDHDMMRQFEVIDPEGPGDDPIGAAPAISNSDEAIDPR